MNILPPEGVINQLLYSTMPIRALYPDGQSGHGTGFFFVHSTSSKTSMPILVTNNHVVRGASAIEIPIRCGENRDDQFVPTTEIVQFRIDMDHRICHSHPDKNVDLCGIYMAGPFMEMRKHGKNPFFRALSSDVIPSDDVQRSLQALEEVVMVGYPIGLWDRVNSYPLLRRGITASPPSVDFQGQPQGVIDAACFPGSSGSPVLIANQGVYSTGTGMTLGSRILFLGVLYAGPQFTVQGKIEIKNIPMQSVPMAESRIPSHLGYYIKAREVLMLVQHMVAKSKIGH